MLKLLKYELLSHYRSYCSIYLFYLLFCLITPFISYRIQEFFIPIIGVSSVAIMISVFINIVVNFCKSMFSKEGYLMHTLPYKNSVLLGSKFLSAILWLCISSVVLLGGIALLSIAVMIKEGLSLKEIYSGLEMLNSFIRYELAMEGITLRFSLGSMLTSSLILMLEGLISTYMLIFMIAIIVNTPWIKAYKVPIGIVIFFAIKTLFGRIGFPNLDNIHLISDMMYNVALVNGVWTLICCLIFYLIGLFVMDRYLEI